VPEHRPVFRRTTDSQTFHEAPILHPSVTCCRRSRRQGADPEADTSEWEAEIDRLVFQLYGLTEEEIAVVEGRAG
jgi:hypothetical protein